MRKSVTAGSHGHMLQKATAVTSSEHLKIYCHVFVTQQRPRGCCGPHGARIHTHFGDV